MKSVLRVEDVTREEMNCIFRIAEEIELGKHRHALDGKTLVLFFPASSIRTRVTFEKGIQMLGGQSILFPSDTLDKKERIEDVSGYLNNWADCLVVRHRSLALVSQMAEYSGVPVINAMTSDNHPCEILSDLYAISKLRGNYLDLRYTFVGRDTNIGKTWVAAASAMGIEMVQCCPVGYEIENVAVTHDIHKAIRDSDIVLTDSVSDCAEAFQGYQITTELMQSARAGALLNPCPPFTCGEEVSEEVIRSEFLWGMDLKKHCCIYNRRLFCIV